jgi:hypothetical protein
MFTYINIFKKTLKVKKVDVKSLMHNLEFKGWRNKTTGKIYSPMDVIKHPKKYPHDMERVNKANLKYPIIVHNNFVVDGMHRLLKILFQNKTQIDAYVFDDNLMNKFKLGKRNAKNLNDQFENFKLIERFYKQFC